MNKNLKISISAALCVLCTVGATFARLEIKPLKKAEVKKVENTVDSKVVYRFFDEDFISGGFAYWYPDNSKVFIPEESGKNGEVALEFDLDAKDYSGGSVCLYNLLYDLTPYVPAGALQFWIRGNAGGEIAWAALVDEENTDGKKTVVRLPLQNYGGISKEWKQISIPLADFGLRGVFWDPKKRVEIPERFSWNAVGEFRCEIKKNDNPDCKIWIDDIFIVKDVYQPKVIVYTKGWDEFDYSKSVPDMAQKPAVNEVVKMYDNELPGGGFGYVYGGKTSYKIQETGAKANSGVLVSVLDNKEYSGVTLALGAGKSVDISALKKKSGSGLAFWAKGAANVNAIYIGLLDDESDGMKVQSKVAITDYGKLDTTWKYYMIPLKNFQDQGKYWDDNKKAEVLGDVKWNQINEIRFSSNKSENKVSGDSVLFYVDQISFIDSIPGYVDPDAYWAAFNSKLPDVLIDDFENDAKNKGWEGNQGPKSEIKGEVVKSGAENGGKNALAITYKMGDYCDMVFNLKNANSPKEIRDWTKHWGLKFNLYTDKPYQGINVQVNDAGMEVFIATAGCAKGWHEVVVPFKAFYKFPYWQPPEAVQNGKFDMDNIITIDFKPSGDGTAGTYMIDNIRLTNDREAKKVAAPEKIALTLTGEPSVVVTEKIGDGLFGINAALWDGDMMKPATAQYVKDVNHSVLRYPGGLRADDDHWEEILNKKDWMIDCDEFLGFCKQTNTTPMFTVNFGSGTPEEAAKWVKHVNVDLKANVKYWEIGNELYGDWHPFHCTGEEYGKKTAEFIKAMKAVDPTIKVTTVWVLEGSWNKDVFKYTKDLADGVNVHHYPQHAGEENNAGLLAAPNSLDGILPGVKRQLKEYGNPDKKYEIWLTEWNSVDFKPGPQTLGIVNALFVADYLGKLAVHNIDQASYWDIHNDMTEQGGDYGYLSRTGAPDGDNVPRPSYWAFKLASESLRGKLLKSSTGNEDVTSYLTEMNGKKTLMLVNKKPETKAVVTLSIPGFSGNAVVKQLKKDNMKQGYSTENVNLSNNYVITLPAYSVTAISQQ
jgi:hypothetical protein